MGNTQASVRPSLDAKQRRRLLFIFRKSTLENDIKTIRTLLDAVRVRVGGGTFAPALASALRQAAPTSIDLWPVDRIEAFAEQFIRWWITCYMKQEQQRVRGAHWAQQYVLDPQVSFKISQ